MPRLTRTQQRNDIVLAVVLLLGGLLSAVLSSVSGIYGDQQGSLAIALGYVAVLAIPLAFRRRWPSVAAVVVSVAYFFAVTFRIPELYAGNIAMFIALYTVGAWEPHRRRATIVRVAIIVGMFAWLFVVMFQDATQPVDPAVEGAFSRAGAFSPFVAYQLLMIGVNALYFGGAYYFGNRTFQQMRQRAALEERTAELEAEREVTAAQAVALDRVRIARELHDVVAHHVSLMGVQAGVARSLLARDPDKTREVLAGIEVSARTSLHELRQLLETLRTPGSEAAPDTAPTTHGLTSISALVDEASAAGLPTTLTIIGKPTRDPAPLVQVNLYRIAQEALTNARRHAGPRATADVRLRFDPDAIELEVANTGRAGSAASGLGQLGMRERAAVSGGTIDIGPRSRGGYLVRVRVPVVDAEVAHV
ncbi:MULTISPECIES: sensor histidine kinase [unclassified Microbacterium]|uniref:sensor histidine kinase n=1 Tax=unclassified Microbacterium TaxID=2609290 RepID=UPI0006F7EAB8|nr:MULTISPECIES: histidine kinase [unclassified Microbacterium]KQT75444.1 histidine kinase [Microbacterium sp. Leaf436]MBD8206845.1 sensor histidine kinase [Microbacterium sp. CFBP 8801]MBD8509264.1 sensor histidine kinase [Microbacterium sp. CFBP 8790]